MIGSLDHLVLTVRDRAATLDFYVGLLGMELRVFAPGREALHFGRQKLNLHLADRPVDPNVRHATPGSADLCFLLRMPLEEMVARVRQRGLAIVTGPVVRTGAQGPIRSIYLYDPDENLVELAEPLLPPFDGREAETNQTFHHTYRARLDQALGDRPLCLVLAYHVLLQHGQERTRHDRFGSSFHASKARGHAFFAEVLRGGTPDFPLEETLREGCRLELEDLHALVQPWWSRLSPEERQACGILVTTPHQARSGRVAVRYFERLTGRRTGLGAEGEDGLVVVEADLDEWEARQALARHYLDQQAAERIFGDRFRLQSDILSAATEEMLDRLL